MRRNPRAAVTSLRADTNIGVDLRTVGPIHDGGRQELLLRPDDQSVAGILAVGR